MAEHEAPQSLDPPRVYLVHMVVFTMLVAILVAVILPGLQKAFLANPVLNGVIIATLLLGMLHSYRMVGRLFREVNWVNRFRHAEKGGDTGRPPQLLAPMATLMKNRASNVFRWTERMKALPGWKGPYDLMPGGTVPLRGAAT